jgi:ubiquinone/menaquinone biosynthesis C-methylase UbiE
MTESQRMDPAEHAAWNEALSKKYDVEAFHQNSWFPIRWVESKRVREVISSLGRVDPKHLVLEVGCGPGVILDRLDQGRLHGIDLSEHSVGLARQKLGDRAEIRHGNAQELPYSDNEFDFVFCTEVLEHVVDPRTAICECFRVLRPGGRLVLSIPNEQIIDFFKGLVRKLGLGRHLKNAGPDGSEGRFGHEWHLHYLTGAQVAVWAEELGGVQVKKSGSPFFFLPLHYIVTAYKKA